MIRGSYIAWLAPCVLAVPAPAQQPDGTLVVATANGTERVRCEVLRATLPDDAGKPAAEMVGFAYLGADDAARPITFLWNGGPGLPSVILHTGFAAPRIVDPHSEARWLDNPSTLIDRTDLVYVDPIGTGLSRAIAPTEEEAYFGLREDAHAAAQFVSAVIAERGWHQRPIHLCGESYGGIRVAAMLAPLRGLGIAPATLILISPALEWSMLQPPPDSAEAEIAQADAVPTLAALAADAGTREPADRRALVDEACRFAGGPLLAAVRAGESVDELPDEDARAMLERVTAGASLRTLRARDPYDARLPFRGSRVGGMRIGVRGRMLRARLERAFGIAATEDYATSGRTLLMSWRGAEGRPIGLSDASATAMIAAACREGRGPRVFVAGGWYDTVVLFHAAHRLAREGAFGACDVELHDYPAGHMIYLDAAAHAMLIADLRAWFDRR